LAEGLICVVIGTTTVLAMAHESLSFRITRNTEDLAQTIHAFSQRLVKLEQRLAGIELTLDRDQDPDPQELTCLDNVERLLADCRELLALESSADPSASACLPNPTLTSASVPVAAESAARDLDQAA
jgi:hypothetical protein